MNSLLNCPELKLLPAMPVETAADLPAFTGSFVDDRVVVAIVRGGNEAPRNGETLDGLVLTPDDMDFAGWCLKDDRRSETLDFQVSRGVVDPPYAAEEGIDAPYRGGHRWWLAGLAGAMSGLLAAGLLLHHQVRHPSPPSEHIAPVSRVMPSRAGLTAELAGHRDSL